MGSEESYSQATNWGSIPTIVGISADKKNITIGKPITQENYNGVMAGLDVDKVTSIDLRNVTLGEDFTVETAGLNPNCLVYLAYGGPTAMRNGVYGYDTRTAPKIELTDGHDFYCPIPFTADEISYTRTPDVWADGAKGWETILLPFDVEGATGYQASLSGPIHPVSGAGNGYFWLRELTGSSNGEVNFQSTANGSMTANTPYIIAFPGDVLGRNNSLQGESITFSASGSVPVPETPDKLTVGSTYYAFHGLYAHLSPSGWMLDDEGGSFLSQNDYAMQPFRAYLSAVVTTSHPQSILISGNAPTSLEPIGANTNSGADGIQILSTPEGVTLVADSPVDVIIRNAAGVAVSTLSLQAGSTVVTHLPAGVYFIGPQKFIVNN